MKKSIFLILVLGITGCSTLKKSVTFGGLTGAALGAAGGIALSPDKYSEGPNALIWGGLGAIAGATLGYYLWNEDPQNKELPPMILDKETKTLEDVENPPMIVPRISNKYTVEKGILPENLRDKVPTPEVIEHIIPERKDKIGGNRTVIIDEHKAYEIIYE